MTTFTVVCRHCCAGWEAHSYLPAALRCRLCGRVGLIRGSYQSIPLRP